MATDIKHEKTEALSSIRQERSCMSSDRAFQIGGATVGAMAIGTAIGGMFSPIVAFIGAVIGAGLGGIMLCRAILKTD